MMLAINKLNNKEYPQNKCDNNKNILILEFLKPTGATQENLEEYLSHRR